MKKVRKAIIPAAGLGTRFLPVTKNTAKEMLPIIDIPTIQLIVEEAVASGIEEILIITNNSKHDMEDYFDINYELEQRLLNSNKIKEYELIHNIAFMSNIHFIHQKEPKGLGHAVLCGKSFVGDEPFAVLLGDDVVKNRNGLPALRQLINAYDEVGCSILGVQEVARDQVNKYGVVKPVKEVSNRLIEINDMIEMLSQSGTTVEGCIFNDVHILPSLFSNSEYSYDVDKKSEVNS